MKKDSFLQVLTTCPKLLKMPLTGLGRGLKINLWGVLNNSGNFQSNEHRNTVGYPHQKVMLKQHSCYVNEGV